MTTNYDSWFVNYCKRPHAKIRLFCFHYAGGGASTFREWHLKLPSFVEVICIQLPGRETRFKEAPVCELAQVIRALNRAIIPYLDRSYVFFGHSIGGLISHQLLHALSSGASPRPEHFIVSGRSAPLDHTRYYDRITHLSGDQFIAGLKEYNGTPPALLHNRELMELYVPLIKSDFRLSEGVATVCAKLSCPITVFGGRQDRAPADKLSLWRHETTKSCCVKMFIGGHFFINEQQDEVLSEITKILIDIENLH